MTSKIKNGISNVTIVDGFCPVDCEYHEWNEWSSCTVTCGGGIKLRSRLIKTHEAHGGLPCDGIQGGGSSLDGIQTGTEKTACNTQICPPGTYFIYPIMGIRDDIFIL